MHCGFSADGSVLVSGSSTGSVHFYDFQSSRTLSTLHAHRHACVCAALHPIIPALTATADWTERSRSGADHSVFDNEQTLQCDASPQGGLWII